MKAVKPTTRHLVNRLALTILAAYALTTVHHIYGGLVDNAPDRLLVPVIMAVPSLIALASLYRYKQTGSGAALATSSIVAVLAWVVLSGLLHGGYAHAYKDILFLLDGPSWLYYPLNPQEHYPPDNIFFEITGVLETVTAYLVGLFTYHLVRDRRQNVRPVDARASDPGATTVNRNPGGAACRRLVRRATIGARIVTGESQARRSPTYAKQLFAR